jgi:hypothetical protein
MWDCAIPTSGSNVSKEESTTSMANPRSFIIVFLFPVLPLPRFMALLLLLWGAANAASIARLTPIYRPSANNTFAKVCECLGLTLQLLCLLFQGFESLTNVVHTMYVKILQ